MNIRRAQFATALFCCASTLVGCARGPTPEEKLQIEAMQSEWAATKQELVVADQESKKYSGGLIKALTDARLAILKTNEALIQQRILALQSHSPVTIQTQVSTPDPGEAQKLSVQITEQETKLAAAQAEAAKYSGGLVQAIALSTAATQAQTLAMLRQRFLIAKLGLGIPAYAAQQAPASAAQPTAELPTSKPTEKEADDELQNQIVKITIVSKEFSKQDFQEFVFFNLKYDASGLDRPSRAIKGQLHITDLFGDSKLSLNWTIDKPLQPGGTVDQKGMGFKYNQFVDAHQWVKGHPIEDMKATFSVTSILYEDGTRRDF